MGPGGTRSRITPNGESANPRGNPPFARETALSLTRATLTTAWRVVSADARAARVLLGLDESVEERLITLPVTAIDAVAEHAHPHLRPRWGDHPAFWRALLRAANTGDSAKLSRIDVQSIQLLTGELLIANALQTRCRGLRARRGLASNAPLRPTRCPVATPQRARTTQREASQQPKHNLTSFMRAAQNIVQLPSKPTEHHEQFYDTRLGCPIPGRLRCGLRDTVDSPSKGPFCAEASYAWSPPIQDRDSPANDSWRQPLPRDGTKLKRSTSNCAAEPS